MGRTLALVAAVLALLVCCAHGGRVTVAIRQRNLARVARWAERIATPGNAEYGRFVSGSQLRQVLAPATEAVQAHLERVCGQRGVASADGTLVVVPECAADAIQHPEVELTVFSSSLTAGARRHRRDARTAAEPGLTVTPASLIARYGQPYPYQPRQSGPHQAVAEFEEAYFYPSDVASYQSMFDLPPNPMANVVGPNKPNSSNAYLGEASLDTQVISINGMSSWVFSHPPFDLLVRMGGACVCCLFDGLMHAVLGRQCVFLWRLGSPHPLHLVGLGRKHVPCWTASARQPGVHETRHARCRSDLRVFPPPPRLILFQGTQSLSRQVMLAPATRASCAARTIPHSPHHRPT